MPTAQEMFEQRVEGTTPRRFFNVKEVHAGFIIEAGTRYTRPQTGEVVAETTDKTTVPWTVGGDDSLRNQEVAALQLRIGNYALYGNFDGNPED